jgi:CRP-like cAMP-binding protein
MIASGAIRLPEIDQRLSAGELFGEVALFSVERRRTQTAVAATDVKLLWISGGELRKLCERNPRLSHYSLRLTATRMTDNAATGVVTVRNAFGNRLRSLTSPASLRRTRQARLHASFAVTATEKSNETP